MSGNSSDRRKRHRKLMSILRRYEMCNGTKTILHSRRYGRSDTIRSIMNEIKSVSGVTVKTVKVAETVRKYRIPSRLEMDEHLKEMFLHPHHNLTDEQAIYRAKSLNEWMNYERK